MSNEVVYPQSEPTDDERETLIDVMVMTKLSDYATTDMSAIRQAVDAILAAGFRLPAQEYEYAMEDDLGMSFAKDHRDAERHASLQSKEYHPRVVRRVKAGAWEPVPNQSDGSAS